MAPEQLGVAGESAIGDDDRASGQWEITAAAPRLTTAVGPMPAPILERMGFERIGGVRLIRDEHAGRARGR